MKKILFLLSFVGLVFSASSQIVISKDTVHHYFKPTGQSESKALITTNSISDVTVKWKILYDDIKTEWDTNVQYCDCDVCISNYPDSSTCFTPINNASPCLTKLYIDPKGVKEIRYLTIVYFDANNTSVSDTVTFVTDPSVVDGVNDNVLTSENDVKLAPNPTTGKTRLSYRSNSGGQVNVVVFDLLGNTAYNTVEEVEAGTSEVDMDFSALERGIYFVTVTDGQKSFTKKLSLK